MTTLRALLYADGRAFVNQVRELRRSPARAILWLVFALLIGAFVVMRVERAAGGAARPGAKVCRSISFRWSTAPS